MPGKRRFQTEQQASVISTFKQESFSGGLILDRPASELTDSEIPVADNVICFPKDIRGRSGSVRFDSTAFPGSGTVHTIKNHSINKRWILHRGSQLWRADATITAWEELKLTGTAGPDSFGIDLDSSIVQNKDDYVIYTTSGIFDIIFSDTGSTDIVYPANGPSPNIPIGSNDGVNATHVYRFLYTYVRLTGTTTNGRITPGALLEQETGSVNIDNPNSPDYGETELSFAISGSSTYKLFFFVSVVDVFPGTDIIRLDTVTWTTGTQIEFSSTVSLPSPLVADTIFYVVSLAVGDPDIKVATTYDNAIAGIVIDITTTGSGNIAAFTPIINNAGPHHTHIGLYMTNDLGSGIVNPVTNTGFNPEEYIWISDVPIPAAAPEVANWSYDVNISQEVWNARLAAGGFLLRTRQFAPVPSGEVGLITGAWAFAATRDDPVIYYSQIIDRAARGISLGYYNAGFQSHKLDDGIKVFVDATDYMIIGTFNKTYMFRLNSSRNVGFLESVFQLTPPVKVDDTIGISQYATVAQISESRFITVCSDSSVRIFNTVKWGEDLSLDRVKDTEIKKIQAGAVAAYYQGAYFIWHPKDTTDTHNINTLRLAVEDQAGEGWTTYSGSNWIKPPFVTGPAVVVDANGNESFYLLDFTALEVYRIETFDGPIGSGITKTYLDKNTTAVISSVKSKEIIGAREANTKQVQEAHAYIRPQVEADGLPSGFEVTAKDYVDGSVTATETITNVPFTGDIEFFKQAEGARLQAEFITNSSEFRLVGLDVDFIEKKRKKISPNITQTDEYQAMDKIASNNTLSVWITKPDYLLNRADGTRPSNFVTIRDDPQGFDPSTGPGGKECTAIIQYDDDGFAPPATFNTITYPYSISESVLTPNNLFISFWVKFPVTGIRIIEATGAYYIQFDDATTINFSGLFTATVDDVTTGAWNYFIIDRDAVQIRVYQNLVEKANVISPILFTGTALVLKFAAAVGVGLGSALEFYDIRIFQDDTIGFVLLSFTDFADYSSDVLNNEGNLYLPYG